MSRKKFWLFPLRKPDRKCSFMAILVGHLGFLPSEGGNVKPCMINSYVMSIESIEVSHESDTLDIILMYHLLKSMHTELSYDQ